MGRYRKIDVRVHADERIRRLSRPKPNGYTLWLYLLSCPFSTIIPGFFRAGEAALAEDLDWDVKAFREVFGEVLHEGLAKYDPATRLVWLPNAIRYNAPESPNVVKSWRTTWDELPTCALKAEAYQRLKASVGAIGEGFAEAFRIACPQPLTNQEQEQEQEQEVESSASATPRGAFSSADAAEGITAPARVATAAPPSDDGFEVFWQAYPPRNGRREKKAEARAAWEKLAPDAALRATISDTVALYARSTDKPVDAVRYLKHRRWEDETLRGRRAPLSGSMGAVARVAERRLGGVG